MLPHYAVIANCVQMKQCADDRDAALPNEKKLYDVGDVALGGTSLVSIYCVSCMMLIRHLVLPFYRASDVVC